MSLKPIVDDILAERAARKAEIRRNTAQLLALRTSDRARLAEALAKNCVKRGKRFLDRRAPLGWWRNCLNIDRSRVRLGRGEESPLALAFEFCANMTDEFGYVQDYIVMKKLGFYYNSRPTDRLGFSTGPGFDGYAPYPRRYADVVLTTELLNAAWAELLLNPTGEMLCQYRHEPTRYMLGFMAELAAKPKRFDFWGLFGRKDELAFP